MHSKKVSKLLQYPGAHSRCFYWYEGEEATKACSLNRHVTELTGLQFFSNLNGIDVILSSSEAEDMEVAVCSIVKATSWMDWWTFAMKSLALQSSGDSCLVCHLGLVGTRCQLLVAKTASTLWANLVLNPIMHRPPPLIITFSLPCLGLGSNSKNAEQKFLLKMR